MTRKKAPPRPTKKTTETVKKTTKKAAAEEGVRLCLCGCGEPVRRTFKQGHDAKLKAKVIRGETLGLEQETWARNRGLL